MAIQLSHHLPTPNLNYDKHPNASLSTTSSSPRFATLRANAISGNPQKLIQSGVVRSILPKEAASIIESEGYKLLDVRPEWEREKALVFGSVHVPLFVEDKDNSPITLLKKWVHFGYIGLWTGQKFTMINPEFLKQVEAEFPNKEAKILSACGEGLRYLI